MKINPKELTIHQQNYVETVYEISNEEGYTHVKDVATKLKKSMPSVSEAMRKLSRKGYVNYDVRKNISLSESGLEMAQELDKRHKILADFYSQILGCPISKAQRIACQVEHIVDTNFCSRMAGFASFLRAKENENLNIIKEFRDYYAQLESSTNIHNMISCQKK